MDNCLFCKIAARHIPSTIVYEDDELLAFKDIHPAAPVHLLIIPKAHVATLSDTEEAHGPLLGRMLGLARQAGQGPRHRGQDRPGRPPRGRLQDPDQQRTGRRAGGLPPAPAHVRRTAPLERPVSGTRAGAWRKIPG
jgi:histidine triad (HIT) family protein